MANLFIAMGGSGVKTIREIRKKDRKEDHFLFIDTDMTDLHGFSEREVVDLSKINVVNYLDSTSASDPVRSRVNEWMDLSARPTMKSAPLSDGASANRPQGRLAIASIADQFKKRIEGAIQAIKDINEEDDDGLNTFIVLSVAGGTGSSIYLDLTKILYDTLISGLSFKFTLPTTVFYMPDFFVNKQREIHNQNRYKTNVFAFWKEIEAVQRDYFGSVNLNGISQSTTPKALSDSAFRETYFYKFTVVPDQLGSQNRRSFQAFGSAILIDHANIDGSTTAMELRYKEVARLLEMISIRSYGGLIKQKLDNSLLENASKSILAGSPWIKQYWTAGFAEIRGGSNLFQEYVKANLKSNLYDTLMGTNSATKESYREFVNPLIEDHLLTYIEKDNYADYKNKAKKVENDKLMNLHGLIDKYWNDNFSANIERLYLDGVESKDDMSADGLYTLFEKDIKSITSSTLIQIINGSGFQSDRIANTILSETYKKCSDIALSRGLQNLNYILEELDTAIDIFSMNYAEELKVLADKQSNVVLDDQNIINRNLTETITQQYSKIKEGPGWTTFRKETWYETELTNLRNLISAYFSYQVNEFALGIKIDICDKISRGKATQMTARENIANAIKKLEERRKSEIYPNANKHLMEKFSSFKNNSSTAIIPDVTSFSGPNTFYESGKNIFKQIFETECGLATRISEKDGKPYFIQQASDKTDANLKSMEDLLRIVFHNKTFVLDNLQSGDESASGFIETFDKLIEENLISHLSTELTQGQSVDNKPTGYAKYAEYTLEHWIQKDSESFNAIKTKFDKRASVFFPLKNTIVPQELWLSPNQLKSRINEIFSAEGNTNIPKYEFSETTEDAIISIKYIANLSFNDYLQYNVYRDMYQDCLKTDINGYYPHIDVRFKKAVSDSLFNVEDYVPIFNVLSGGMSGKPDPEKELKFQESLKFLTQYAQLFYLAKFYAKLINGDDKCLQLYKDMVKSDEGHKATYSIPEKNICKPPVNIDGNRIMYFESVELNKEGVRKNGAVWLSTAARRNDQFEVLDLEMVTSNLEKVMMDEPIPQLWRDLASTDQIREWIFDSIKLQYNLTTYKTEFKAILTSTTNEVLAEINNLKPTVRTCVPVFERFQANFSEFLRKLVN
jgi:hypothetical protein